MSLCSSVVLSKIWKHSDIQHELTKTLKVEQKMSYSVCVWVYIQDLVGGKAVFPELFVGLGVVLNLYSPDLGNQDSISTPTL